VFYKADDDEPPANQEAPGLPMDDDDIPF